MTEIEHITDKTLRAWLSRWVEANPVSGFEISDSSPNGR